MNVKSNLDQPEPMKNDTKPLWPMVMNDFRKNSFYYGTAMTEAVVEDMRERHEVGVKRYGTALQAFNGRNPVVDAYQEVLDTLVYLKQAIVECPDDKPVKKLNLEQMYEQAMDIAVGLRVAFD